MEDCIFCKIANAEAPCHKIYEDEDVLAFLDINPVNPGHSLVIPKSHHKDILNTPTELASKLIAITQKIAPAILRCVGCEDFNIAINCGKSAGQIVMHTHFHIIPRFEKDGRLMWKGKNPNHDELFELAEEIKNNL